MPEGEVVRPRRHAPDLACVLTLVLVLWGCGSGGGGDVPAPEPVSPPPQPTGLTAEAGDGEVELSWTAIAAAIRWDYRQRTGDGAWGAWTTVPGSGGGTTGHTVEDLENGATYGFQVRAVNAGGAGPASGEATATLVPPQPENLTATAGDGLVEMSWTALDTAASGWEYRQREGDGEWGPWTTVPDSGPETTGHTVAELENGTTYGFQVRAVNAGGAGTGSAEATATPVPPVPPQPADLTATAGDRVVELSWTALDTASGWEYRQREGDGEWGLWTPVPDSGSETAGHTVADLENGATYGFQVRAVNLGGAGPASAEATATPVPPVPAQPADLTATAGDRVVELSWTALDTASGWEYRQREGDGEWGLWTPVPDSGSETAGHTVADLENGTTYGFQVRAVNLGGAGPASAEATAIPVPPVPPQPADLRATAGDGLVDLSWTAMATATGWEYRLRTGDGEWGPWTPVPDSGPETKGHTVADLENGATYGFQVRAVNAGGAGPASAEATATLVPPQPENLTATAGDGLVALSWTALDTASEWEYRQREGDGGWGPWTPVPDSGPETAGHTVADLENGTTYGFQVRAVNAGGAGPASAEAMAAPVDPGVPVEIPDANLRRVLERALGKAHGATITDVDLRSLSELRAEGKGIIDLTGLEHATGLEWADLAENDIVDIAPLAFLALLTRLELGTGAFHNRATGNRVSDLTPLSSLVSLEYLELSHNAVSDISPLAGLTSLTHLGLTYNDVADPQPLSGLSSLTRLDLRYNQVSDLAPLSSLASLEHLDLTGNRVSDVSALAGLRELRVLWMYGNAAVDLSPLAGLTSLERLNVGSNGVVDLGPLSDLTSLTHLSIHNNHRIVDVSALRGLVSLEELTIRGMALSEMEPLSSLTSLRYLNMSHTRARDLSFVAGMVELTDLSLWSTYVEDLRPLASLRKLERLGISDTAVDDLSPLENLTSLQRLGIVNLSPDLAPLSELKSLFSIVQTNSWTEGARPKVDISPLSGLTNLTWLWASPMHGDLSPLAGLASLEHLHLYEPGAPFENPQALQGLAGLRELTLERGGLEEVPALAESAVLLELNLEGNGIEDLAPLAGREYLRLLDLDDNRVRDIAPLVENPGLGDGDTISLVGNPLGPDALRTHIPELESRGASVAYDRDDFPDSPLRVLRDGAVSMRVDVDLETAGTRDRFHDLDFAAYAEEFISHFGDEFDVLLFLSALESTSDHADLPYAGVYHHVSNDVRGIGLGEIRQPPDNAIRLKGLIHFPWLNALAWGPSLHEIMHIWANHGVETAYSSHWGFSSAEGQLGGFRLDDLVDLGGGLWSAGIFGTITNGGNGVPYSPWELYLGGFVGPDEVPDLWNAPDGRWTGERTEAGHSIFEAVEHSKLTVEEFVETHGSREPDHASAPKELRGAVIVLEDDDHRLHHWDDLLEQVRWLSHPGPETAFRDFYNYHEATGGRGRLVLDGLRELRRETPLTAIPELRLMQVCPAPGMPAVIGAAALAAPDVEMMRTPTDFREHGDPRPGGRTEDLR